MSSMHITSGEIVKRFYYSRALLWFILTRLVDFFKDNNNQVYPIPICLGLEILVQLNKKSLLCVVHNIHNLLQPDYICKGSRHSSGINICLSNYFCTKPKFSGLVYLGLSQTKTTQKLLEDIAFHLFIVKLENIAIYIGSLSKII
ncbi:hypothetical protein F8M41_000332 [Gigaspora margarita]|uniref:Uncharacterized protein n=1 Tax=Gigaspora margarita TaxID=4874 RepID=A0A8H4AA74_GIGMA|nr:hypothetical protein F8M41_000332 [Gigaspora margarita]